jgi:hypothetical protein
MPASRACRLQTPERDRKVRHGARRSRFRFGDEQFETTLQCPPTRRRTPRPNKIEGSAFDHRADLFVLGVAAFELVCGSRPHAAAAFAWLWGARSHVTAEQRARGLPDRQVAIAASCLAARPCLEAKIGRLVADRFSSSPGPDTSSRR